MRKNKDQLFQFISSIILAIIIAALQLLPGYIEKHNNDFSKSNVVKWLDNNSFWIVIICGVLIVMIYAIGGCIQTSKLEKQWSNKLLQSIADSCFFGNNNHTRLTIFRPNNNGKKLKQFARFTYPENENVPAKPIKVSTERERYNGVVDKCFREGRIVEAHASSLSSIVLSKKFDENEHCRTIEKYLKDTFIDKSHYQTLLKMHRKSTNLYACPILFSDDKTIWGVLIIDNDDSTEFQFTPESIDLMSHYINIFKDTVVNR